MPDNVLDVIINFTKKGSGDTEAKAGIGKLKDAFKDLTGISLGSATALGMAGIGIKKVADFTKEAITDTVAYNQAIRENSQRTGLNVEETSRLIQVSDDWGISMEGATSAMEMMNKKGVSPSIDNLAKIADEFVNSTDKAAFAEEAQKKYGRSFSTLIPILAQGGKSLREQTDAVDDNLIATEESIKASRDYEVAMDGWNDGVLALKYNIGNGLIPTLTDLLIILNGGDVAQNNYNQAVALGKKYVEAGAISQENWNTVANKTGFALDRQAFLLKGMNPLLASAKTRYEQLTRSGDEVNHTIGALTITTEGETEAQEDLTKASIDYQNVIGGPYRRSLEGAREKIREVKNELDDQAEATEAVQRAYDDLDISINSRLGPEMEDFTNGQSDLEQQMLDVQSAIDTAISQGYSPLGEKILGLKEDYGKLKGQYTENETEHDRATKEIMWDMLEQKLALGGLSTAEGNFLQEIATAWELPYQATLTYMANQDEAINWLTTHPDDTAGARAILEGQKEAWQLTQEKADLARAAAVGYIDALNQMDGKVVNTEIHETTYHDTYERTYFLPGGAQHGANFIVPPGYPNDSYPMWVESGEQVRVTPADQVRNNYNLNIYSNAPHEDIIQDFELMRSLARKR